MPLTCLGVADLAAGQGPVVLDRNALVRTMGLQAGLWRTRTEIMEIEIRPLDPARPLPPNAPEAAQAGRGRVELSEICFDAVSDPAALLPGISIAIECTFDTLEAADGRLSLTARCGGPASGFEGVTSIEGSYTPTSMNHRLAVRAVSRGAGMATQMSLASTSRRVGDCP